VALRTLLQEQFLSSATPQRLISLALEDIESDLSTEIFAQIIKSLNVKYTTNLSSEYVLFRTVLLNSISESVGTTETSLFRLFKFMLPVDVLLTQDLSIQVAKLLSVVNSLSLESGVLTLSTKKLSLLLQENISIGAEAKRLIDFL
jgi:hypothetical protein